MKTAFEAKADFVARRLCPPHTYDTITETFEVSTIECWDGPKGTIWRKRLVSKVPWWRLVVRMNKGTPHWTKDEGICLKQI